MRWFGGGVWVAHIQIPPIGSPDLLSTYAFVVNYYDSVIVTEGSTPIFYIHYIGIVYPEARLYISI